MSQDPTSLRADAKATFANTHGSTIGSDNVYSGDLSDSDSESESDSAVAGYSAALVARFWAKVNTNGPVPLHCPELGACWLWTASTIRGYGQFVPGNGQPRIYAHRFSYELTYGSLGGPAVKACHRCDRPKCVRPSHLFKGSQQENLADARRKGRLDSTAPRTRVLTLADRLAIYATPDYYGVGRDLARSYGVTKVCIHHIRKGRFAGAPGAVVLHPRVSLLNVEPIACVQVPVRGVLHLEDSSALTSTVLDKPLVYGSRP